jgi:protocatechuate 3,4-dioxygenase, alpha subunit
MSARLQTPSQTVGPFFSVGLTHALQNVLVDEGVTGERMRVEGRVVDGAGVPVDDAMIEVWQADADGHYRHPLDRGAVSSGSRFTGFGRAETTPEGAFCFETIKPGPVRSADGGWQAPHLNVIVFARGMLLHAFTRMYFSDDPRNAGDALLARVDPARRSTLMGQRTDRDQRAVYQWDIHLQGAHETVFLDA